MSKATLARIASFTITTTVLLLFCGNTITANNTFSAFIAPPTKSFEAKGTSATRTFYANGDNNKEKKEPVMKAWTCHGRNQKDLVDRLIQAKIVKEDSVRDVLYKVDRKNFAEGLDNIAAYMDTPQPIGLGQTISAPHMHAHVLEEMYPFLKNSNSSKVKILDVGCGSGYLTAALGRWVAPLSQSTPDSSLLDAHKTGKVFGIDIYPHLVDLTKRNMEKCDKDLLDNKIVTLSNTDGWVGLPDDSPFDAIHVGAAAAEFPRSLLQQLKVGGVLIIPVGPEGGMQNLYRVERLGDGFTQEDFRITELLGVRYVPLVQKKPDLRN
jgi:protein-L-isoaspartate(D-aspartate) O-methyltransferase